MIIEFTDSELQDIRHGLIIAMKELDKYSEGRDKILSDKLENILKRIDKMQNLKS